MRPDVIDLRDFYASSLGQVTCRIVRRQIRDYWTDTTGLNVLGVGFATPYMLPFCDEASRIAAIMPARMGVLPWSAPDGGEHNAVCLSDEAALPFPDLSMDRILVVHGLEYTEQANALLRELWRVLADGGRLLVVVPNRRGTWAHADNTPFGHGHPYSLDQLNRTLRQSIEAHCDAIVETLEFHSGSIHQRAIHRSRSRHRFKSDRQGSARSRTGHFWRRTPRRALQTDQVDHCKYDSGHLGRRRIQGVGSAGDCRETQRKRPLCCD